MLQVTREVVTDVVNRSTSKLVTAKQNDDGSRFLNVRIQNGGKDVNIDSTATVLFNVKRPDDSTGTLYGSVNDDGTVRIELTAWVLEHPGKISCDISIISKESAKLTTMTFYIEIEPAVCCDEDIVDAEEYSVLVDLISQTQQACDVANEAAETAEQAMQRVEEGMADGSLACSHSWNGSVLTVTSASGTSSADLRGPVGPMGPAGPAADGLTAADIGLGNVDNTSDMDKPVSTAQQTALDGKAPAGYGLGEINGRRCEDCDTALENGFYNLSGVDSNGVVCKNVPTEKNMHYGTMLVERRGNALIQQTVTFSNLSIIRCSGNGGSTWNEWEWVNPPMVADTEYRTTERCNSKSVYKRLNSSTGVLECHLEGESTWYPYNVLVGADVTTATETTQTTTEAELETILTTMLGGMKGSEAKQIKFVCDVLGNWSFYGILFKNSSKGGYGSLIAYAEYRDTVVELRKAYYNGAWHPFEWVRPYFKDTTTEYRTTERFNSKPVYAKQLNFQNGAVGGKAVAITSDTIEHLVRVDGCWTNGSNKFAFDNPYLVTGIEVDYYNGASRLKVNMVSSSYVTDYTGYPVVYYTKK